jgi:hypothetical protein
METYKNNTIKKTQRSIACLLLLSQLLTSCGGNTMILPADQKTTIQETKCIDDEHSPLDTQPTTFIDGTPLKLGQPEIKFTWDNNKGLQAFAKDPEMGTATAYIPVKLPTIIKPGNENKPIILNQLNKVQAEFVARNFKWEVTREGVLQENGVRLRGGGARR